MRILVAVDIEGIAGVVNPEQTRAGNPEYERARRLMTAEANAAVEGAIAGGATVSCHLNSTSEKKSAAGTRRPAEADM